MDFRWTPNKTLDPRIIERMKAAFAEIPTEPPPVAWFMSLEQEYFDDLFAKTLADDQVYIYAYLLEVGGGLKNFGRFEIWVKWFLWMLPYLVEICYREDDFQVGVVNYLLNMYKDGIAEEYPGFRDDLLESVGQIVMSQQWWSSPDILRTFFAEPNNRTIRAEEWSYSQSDGWNSSFLCSMFFCLKFLHESEIAGWVDSIAAVDTPEWRLAVADWLKAFKSLLYLLDNPEKVAAFKQPPSDYRHNLGPLGSAPYIMGATNLAWDDSYVVFLSLPADILKTFFPTENTAAFWNAVNKHDWMREANKSRVG